MNNEENINNKEREPIQRDLIIEYFSKIYDSNSSDPYILSKIEYFILNQLPSNIESLKLSRERNYQKTQEKISDQDSFIQSFLNNYSYFYIPSTERFFYYNGINYKPYGEEDILNHIFREVSKETHLTTWKQRTKISTLKRIKEQSIFKSIPNSETIQSVISMFYPVFFSSKTQTKYFLTILGDNILKKTQGLIYFINPNAKHFLREIDNYGQQYFGCHPSSSFKYKYHDHEYSSCRLININESIKFENLYYPFLKNYFLDILCVSVHYSNRFNNSDDYLKLYSNDDELIHYSYYLKDRSPTDLMQQFCDEYIVKVESTVGYSWKTVHYLWKRFLESKGLPTVIFQNELIQFFTINYNYNSVDKTIPGIFSKFIPVIERFIKFWEETITIIPTTELSDFEIDEIIVLFKKWLPVKDGLNITERQALDLIIHFFPGVENDGEKYLFNIKSRDFDKEIELQNKLDSLNIYFPNNNIHSISIDDTYILYCKSAKNDSRIVVSKIYFEKYIFENLREFILEDNLISLDFWKK
jgi:hypothetical protein